MTACSDLRFSTTTQSRYLFFVSRFFFPRIDRHFTWNGDERNLYCRNEKPDRKQTSLDDELSSHSLINAARALPDVYANLFKHLKFTIQYRSSKIPHELTQFRVLFSLLFSFSLVPASPNILLVEKKTEQLPLSFHVSWCKSLWNASTYSATRDVS